jgi:hypothetical protein
MRTWRIYGPDGFIEYASKLEAFEIAQVFLCEVEKGFRTVVLL